MIFAIALGWQLALIVLVALQLLRASVIVDLVSICVCGETSTLCKFHYKYDCCSCISYV